MRLFNGCAGVGRLTVVHCWDRVNVSRHVTKPQSVLLAPASATRRGVSRCAVFLEKVARTRLSRWRMWSCQSSNVLSVQVAAVAAVLAQLFQLLITQQLAQAGVDIATHAVEAAAQVNSGTVGQPGAQGAG